MSRLGRSLTFPTWRPILERGSAASHLGSHSHTGEFYIEVLKDSDARRHDRSRPAPSATGCPPHRAFAQQGYQRIGRSSQSAQGAI